MTPLEEVSLEVRELTGRIQKLHEEMLKMQARRRVLTALMHDWGLTFREIASEVGLSQQRIRQIYIGINRKASDKVD